MNRAAGLLEQLAKFAVLLAVGDLIFVSRLKTFILSAI
jgi:hypothetical protein